MKRSISIILTIALAITAIIIPVTAFAQDIPNVSVSSTESVASGFKVSWKEAEGVTGYEMQYSKSNNKFEDKNTKTSKIDDSTNTSKTIKKLTPQRTYYVRVRAYITSADDKSSYGQWSKSKKVITGIDGKKKMVALSFDDGPAYNGATGTILDTLEKYNAHATFFMVGNRVNSKTKKYLKREIKLGCELGNHTYNHEHYGSRITASDISKCSKQIKKTVGKNPTIFRCPGGTMSTTIQNEAKKEKMPIAYWSVDTEDWRTRNTSKTVSAVKKHVYNGSIILMHDIYIPTANAVKIIVPYLVDNGYQIVTVSELVKYKGGKSAKAGQQYIDYKKINNHTR